MATATVSARLDAEELEALDSLASVSHIDRSTLVKILLRRGMKMLALERAVAAYRAEEVTLSRAAEMSGVSVREFLSQMGGHAIELHYDVEELQEDLVVPIAR
jgi:predicted HTH domain antitoxin